MTTKTKTTARDSFILGLPSLMLFMLLAVGTVVVTANAADPASVDGNEVDNTPTFETHGAEAVRVCGGKVFPPAPGVVSDAVAVVMNDASVVKMPTSEAYDRNTDANEGNNVWVVGVCK